MPRPRTGASLIPYTRCERHGGKCWRGLYYDHAGRRRELALHALSKPDARKALEQVAAEAALDQAGVTCRAERVTVRDYYEREYRPALERGELKESTVLKRMEHIETHWLPALGTLPLGSLNDATVSEARGKLKNRKKDSPSYGKPVSGQMLATLDTALSALVHHAALMGFYGPAPALDESRRRWQKPWRSPKRPAPKDRHAVRTVEEMSALLEAAREEGGLDVAAMVTVALVTGARRGELVHMRRDHVHRAGEDDFTVSVPASATKTGKAYVGVFVGGPARILAAHLDELAAELPETEWLFPVRQRVRWKTQEGRRVVWHVAEPGEQRRTYALSDARWERIKERAGLPRELRIHDLKGSYIKHMQRSGASREEMRRAARHSRVETIEHYTRDVEGGEDRRVGELFRQLSLGLAIKGAAE